MKMKYHRNSLVCVRNIFEHSRFLKDIIVKLVGGEMQNIIGFILKLLLV